MNSASYCKLVISTALCRVWISTRVLKLINIQWETINFERKKKSTDDIMQVGPLMFLFALSLMPLCQTQHPPITLSQAVYSSRYYFACNKSLPPRGAKLSYKGLSMFQLHHMNSTRKIMRNLVAGILAVERRLC